tara:strand:+ start:604 stop:1908 length:1305 start_codon:yes stop_codon:yes gene_type:complete
MLGKSVAERKAEIEQILEDNTRKISDHNLKTSHTENENYPVYEVGLDLLKYRIGNTRTIFDQKSYINEHGLDKNFFDGDPESAEIQKAQHAILQEAYHEKGLYEAFKGLQKQSQPLIVTLDGFVIAGNRRLAAFRDLYEEDYTAYKHFKEVKIVIFKKTVDSDQVKDFEALQEEEKDIKSNFSWISVALGFEVEVKRFIDEDPEEGRDRAMKAIISRYENTKYINYKRYSDQIKEIEGWIFAANEAMKMFNDGSLTNKEIKDQEQVFKDWGKESFSLDIDLSQKKIYNEFNRILISADANKFGKRKYEIRKKLKKNLPRLIKEEIKKQDEIDKLSSDIQQREKLLELYKSIPKDKIVHGLIGILDTIKQEDDFKKEKNALKSLLVKISGELETASIKAASALTDFEDFEKLVNKIKSQLSKLVEQKEDYLKNNR